MGGAFSSFTDGIGLTNWSGQEEAAAAARDYFTGMETPEQKELILDKLVKTGQLTPELAQTILQEETAFNDINTDPELKSAQYDALMGLQERGQEGLTASDKLALEKIRLNEATQSRGNREAIIQNAAMQGRSGGGLEMLQQMQNQQSSAQNQAIRDAEQAAMSQNQKMQALLQSGPW